MQDFVGAFGVLERGGQILLAGNRRRLGDGAPDELVFDLPGGRVEANETLPEALRREWLEETGLAIEIGRFLFVQEGTRERGGRRDWVWRSFFFEVTAAGEPVPKSEVVHLLWIARARIDAVLGRAPYHAGFQRWLVDGEPFQVDSWSD